MNECNYIRRPLTESQAKVLAFVRTFVAERGFPPTRAEISRGLGWSSANAAEDVLRALVRKGYVSSAPGVARGLRVLEAA